MASTTPVGAFPAKERVRKRREFLVIQAGGRRVTTPHFVLLQHGRAEPGTPRLGVVASRKVGNAVTRNRGKRLVREAFRATRDLWMPGIDLVVIVRRPLEQLALADVAVEWRAAAPLIARRGREALGQAGASDVATERTP